jgi:hypothetical protein
MSELVPELHDLLKLTRLGHDVNQWKGTSDFETFQPFFPRNIRTWQGVLQHHCDDWYETAYPTEPETFHLHIADWLASSFSRSGERGKGTVFAVHKLWKPPIYETEDVRLQTDQEIISLFTFCSNDPSWEECFRRYEHIFRNRAEDANPGKNIVSLYTHCKLTGQFYRILRIFPKFDISQKEVAGKTREEITKLVRTKRDTMWQLTVARCKFHFFQYPFRARDLNIFTQLEDLTQQIKSSYSDNVLLTTSNELILVVSDENQLSDMGRMAHQRGFWAEIIKNQRLLRELHPNPEAMSGEAKRENLYELPKEISPPICDLCQAAKATRHWPEDYVLSHRELCPECQDLVSQNPLSSVVELLCPADKAKLEDIIEEPMREDLCENCFSLRAKEPKLPKLARWREDAQTRIAWLKVSLDFDQLTKTLEKLYSEQFPGKEAEIRFSVIGEFQEDYSHFLRELDSRIQRTFKTENVEKVMSDFFCIKVASFKETLKILQAYHQLLEDFFPAFLDLDTSPLKIAIVCANPKFPFFEVWEILEGAEADVFISLQGSRTLRASARALRLLIEAANKRYRKSALHKLTKIEETSKTLAELVFRDRSDKDSRTYFQLSKALYPQLDFTSIFTFARLVED